VRCKARQFHVAHVVAHESARETKRVGVAVGEAPVPEPDRCSIEKGQVEPNVVPHDHRITEELEERGECFLDPRRVDDHRLGDAGHDGHRWGDPGSRVDERLEPADLDTALIARGADLGDRICIWGQACGLEVEHAERHLRKGGAELLERSLSRGCHPPRIVERVFDVRLVDG